jgi:hypothetical protein
MLLLAETVHESSLGARAYCIAVSAAMLAAVNLV